MISKAMEKVLSAATKLRRKNGLTNIHDLYRETGLDQQKLHHAIDYLAEHDLLTKISGSYLWTSVTPDGLEYFSTKKQDHKRWMAEHWYAPFGTGFLSGVIATLVTSILVKWLLSL